MHSEIQNKIKIIFAKDRAASIGSRIIKGAYWSFVGSVISQLSLLLVSVIVARIIGIVQFGELGIIRSTASMFSAFAGFGLGLTATKYVAELRIKDKARAGKIIGLTAVFSVLSGLLISIIVLSFTPFIAKAVSAPWLQDEIRFSVVILFTSSIIGAQNGILYGFESFKLVAKVNFITALISFPVQIGLVYCFGLFGALLGLAMNSFILVGFNHLAIRKELFNSGIRIQYKRSFDELPIILKYSIPALLSGLLLTPVFWICNSLLVKQPNGFKELALFNAANQWTSAILFVPTVISKIVLPLFASSENKMEFIKILKLNIAINFIITFFMAILMIGLAPIIMGFYGAEFRMGSAILVVLSFSNVLIGVNNVIGQAIAGKDKMWSGFLLNLLWAIVLLLSVGIFFNLNYGAKGLAYAFLISYTFHTIVVAAFTKKFIINNNEVI